MSREGSASADEKSAKCGFRDFRFADGYFRLNERRTFLKSTHFGGASPMTGIAPFDPGMLRRDFLSMKLMGFNMARCIAGLGRRYMMDLADELGFLIYNESYAAWCVTPSPQMTRRWSQTVAGMIRRDRNHPSVVIWGLLNETGNNPVFLSPAVFAKGKQPTALLPLPDKGGLATVDDWLYQNNDWAMNHPIFKGLPTGLLDYQFYRDILGNKFFTGQTAPSEIVAGMINTSLGYNSGLTVSVHRVGKGRLVLNSQQIRENLSAELSHPVAERLLRNMLNFAGADHAHR